MKASTILILADILICQGYFSHQFTRKYLNAYKIPRLHVKSEQPESLSADRKIFKSFYKINCGEQEGMTLDQLRTHDDLSIMISQVSKSNRLFE